MVTIKNCGLRTQEAITAAIDSGAHYLGFINFPKSPRHIEAEKIAALTSDIPNIVQTVLVMVNPSNEAIEHHLNLWTPSVLQLHGDEPLERVKEVKQRFQLPVIKAFGIHNANDIKAARSYDIISDYLLFDAKDEQQRGGTGLAFDWSLLKGLQTSSPWILSGGLNISNIQQALEETSAQFIDVSSGIESERGIKDIAKITAFNQKVQSLSS